MNTQSSTVPSSARLAKSIASAIAVAGLILVTIVLPAEYGIDPTGIGARLGLNALAKTGEPEQPAPQQPPASAGAPAAPTAAVELDAVGQPVKPIESSAVVKRQSAYRSDRLTLELLPGKGGEIKAPMKAGDGMVFHWTATGLVSSDMHGERTGAAKDEYTSYWIAPAQADAAGTFTAPFDGVHGWYWLNKGSAPVTVEVEVAGFQEKLYFPGHP